MFNKVILIGRIATDIDFRFTAGSGIAVARFTLAVQRDYKNPEGKHDADFPQIICWRKLAEVVANNLSKGRMVAVSGSIQTSSYQAQDGSKRYRTDVVADEVKFLDWPKEQENKEAGVVDGFYPIDDSDDIPF